MPDPYDAQLDAIFGTDDAAYYPDAATRQPMPYTSSDAASMERQGYGQSLQDIMKRKGKVSEIRYVGSKTVSDPLTGLNKPNPDLVVEYRFPDGTYYRVRASDSTPLGGTAENEPKVSAPSVRDDPYGNSMQWNADKNMWEPAPGMPMKSSAPDVRQVGNSVIQRNPSTGQWDVVYTAPTAPREPTGQLTEYQKWQIANYGPEQEYARGRDSVVDLQKQQEREAENLRNNATNYTSAWREALKYRTAPGVEYIPGFEPGGLIEDIQKRRGRNYNADPWRTTSVQFDPWRAALDTYK